MNFEFSPEDHIDTKFYMKFLDSTKYPNLTAKLKEDLHKNNKDIIKSQLTMASTKQIIRT